MNEPTKISAGDTVYWERSAPTLPDANGTIATSDNYTLTYYIRPQTSGNTDVGAIAASAKGPDYSVTIAAATTDGWGAGIYYWEAYITATGVRYKIDSGSWEVTRDFADAGYYDNRSHVKKTLDALEAVILGKASADQLSYSIAGRSISKFSPEQLLMWRDKYLAYYQAELSEEKINKGLSPKNRILTRL